MTVRCRPRRRAFSIIELMVVMGMIMIITGLLMPGLARTRDAALQTKWLTAVRTGALALSLYESDIRSFPLSHDLASACGQRWATAVASAGYVSNRTELDFGLNVDGSGYPTVWMSYTLAANPRWFMPPGGPDAYAIPSAPVRADMIAFPSEKGILVRVTRDGFVPDPDAFCCQFPEWAAPVAMADGSARLATWTEFVHPDDLNVVNNIGVPVLTTWGGYLARD